ILGLDALDAQRQHPVLGLDRDRRFLVATQDIHPGLLLWVTDGELEMVLAATPVADGTVMRSRPVAVPRVFAGLGALRASLGSSSWWVTAQGQGADNGQTAHQHANARHRI